MATIRRYQCMKCGSVHYYDPYTNEYDDFTKIFGGGEMGDALPSYPETFCCGQEECSGVCANVTENMTEIAEAFHRSGYCISSATGSSGIYDDTPNTPYITIFMGFKRQYVAEIFPALPTGFRYISEKEDCIYYSEAYKGTEYEIALAMEDALSDLYAWITDLETSGRADVWRLAGYFN